MDPVRSTATGCLPSPFSYQACKEAREIFYSAVTTGTCPSGTSGEQVVIEAGRFTSFVSQADADAQAAAELTKQLAIWCVLLPPPVITSGAATVLYDGDLHYDIAATNTPISYAAQSDILTIIDQDQANAIVAAGGSLLDKVVIDTTTGVITAQFQNTAVGEYIINLSATNGAGTGQGALTLTIKPQLEITLTDDPFGTADQNASQIVRQIAIDGGGWQTMTFGQMFAASNSVKFRITGTAIPLTQAQTIAAGFNIQLKAGGKDYAFSNGNASFSTSYGTTSGSLGTNPSTRYQMPVLTPDGATTGPVNTPVSAATSGVPAFSPIAKGTTAAKFMEFSFQLNDYSSATFNVSQELDLNFS